VAAISCDKSLPRLSRPVDAWTVLRWHDRDQAPIGTWNRKRRQPSYAATVAKILTACAGTALLRAGEIEIGDGTANF
jgi:hypothetical protein